MMKIWVFEGEIYSFNSPTWVLDKCNICREMWEIFELEEVEAFLAFRPGLLLVLDGR